MKVFMIFTELVITDFAVAVHNSFIFTGIETLLWILVSRSLEPSATFSFPRKSRYKVLTAIFCYCRIS